MIPTFFEHLMIHETLGCKVPKKNVNTSKVGLAARGVGTLVCNENFVVELETISVGVLVRSLTFFLVLPAALFVEEKKFINVSIEKPDVPAFRCQCDYGCFRLE
jgi:hypothetical protein